MDVLLPVIDYVPTILFLDACIIIYHNVYNRKCYSRIMNFLIFGGLAVSFGGGFLGATHILFINSEVHHFEKLGSVFYPLQSFGSLLGGVSLMLMSYYKKIEENLHWIFLMMSFLLIFMFITPIIISVIIFSIGYALIYFRIGRVAYKYKQKLLILYFVCSYLMILVEGFLNLIEIKTIKLELFLRVLTCGGHGLFFYSCYLLHMALPEDMPKTGTVLFYEE